MNANLNYKQIAVESIAYGVVLAVAAIGGAFLAGQLVAVTGGNLTAQSIAANTAMAIVLVSAVAYALKPLWNSTSTSETSSELTTKNDYLHVIRQTDDGYGLGIWDRDHGATLVEFDDEGVAYEEVWVLPDEVDDVTAALEEHARE